MSDGAHALRIGSAITVMPEEFAEAFNASFADYFYPIKLTAHRLHGAGIVKREEPQPARLFYVSIRHYARASQDEAVSLAGGASVPSWCSAV